MAWMPGVLQPRTSAALASTMDILATAADVAGAPLPKDRIIDGKSLVGVLTDPTAPSPHDFLFHYCSSRVMAVRHGPYKAKLFEEQLPFPNYTAVHCTAGSPHGEFFQTWNCFGQGVTPQVPPQLFDVESDPSELFPLPVEEGPCQPTGPVYKQTGLFTLSPLSSSRCDAALFSHSNIPLLLLPPLPPPPKGMPREGYANFAMETADIDACRAKCCGDANCGSVTMSTYTAGHAMNCNPSTPVCCWLNPREGGPLDPTKINSTVAFVTFPYTGPYGPVMNEIAAALANHHSTMVPGTPQLGQGTAAAQPCCGQNCTCNYPNPNP